MIWGLILFFVGGLLLFGFIIDKKTDRYKIMSEKETIDGLESIKDDAQKHNPPNINHTDHW